MPVTKNVARQLAPPYSVSWRSQPWAAIPVTTAPMPAHESIHRAKDIIVMGYNSLDPGVGRRR